MAELPNATAVIRDTTVAIGRTGATALEVGWLDDDPPHRWWATATFRGRKVTCDNQDDPAAAVLGLYAILAAGGRCTTCGRTVALDHAKDGLTVGARMRKGVFETRTATSTRLCVRAHGDDGWSSCDREEADRG